MLPWWVVGPAEFGRLQLGPGGSWGLPLRGIGFILPSSEGVWSGIADRSCRAEHLEHHPRRGCQTRARGGHLACRGDGTEIQTPGDSMAIRIRMGKDGSRRPHGPLSPRRPYIYCMNTSGASYIFPGFPVFTIFGQPTRQKFKLIHSPGLERIARVRGKGPTAQIVHRSCREVDQSTRH